MLRCLVTRIPEHSKILQSAQRYQKSGIFFRLEIFAEGVNNDPVYSFITLYSVPTVKDPKDLSATTQRFLPKALEGRF